MAEWTMIIVKRLLFLVALLAPLTGCAVFDEKNRILLNRLDESIHPESVPARVALAPIGIPAGTLALAIDAVAIHPVVVIPDAWEDVYDLYWKPKDIDILRKSLYFPLCVVLTPPSFAGDWFFRSAFMVD